MEHCLEQMDVATRAVVLRLWAGDVAEQQNRDKGKKRADAIDDFSMALAMTEAEVDAYVANLLDRAMAQSIARAVHEDRDAVDDDSTPQSESSSWAAARPVATPRPIRPVTRMGVCVACDDHLPFHELARLPCSHEYCRRCLSRLVTDSLTDEALWPPRCCRQRIPAEEDQIRIFLSGQLMGQYLARKLEMETPNRIYCHKPDCSKFIPPHGIKDEVGTCPKCEAKTCAICKGAAHDGHDCPQDAAGQQLMALAEQQGWKQCFSCNRIVELSYGCNHISECRVSSKHVDAAPSSATSAARLGTPGLVSANSSTRRP